MPPDRAADLQLLAGFLARRDVDSLDPRRVGRTFDVLVLCGSAVLASVDVAARAFHDGVVGSVLVTGGTGHSTPYLAAAVRRHRSYRDVPAEGRPEAEILAEILRRHHAVPGPMIVTEVESTNCGENAALSLRMLADRSPGRPTVLLVQDPTMQRRTHASFDHHQRGSMDPLDVFSYAPFVPEVRPDRDAVGTAEEPSTWSLDRFTSLALGEIGRLRDDEHGYGPRGAGFIGHVDVPDDVLSAYERLRATLPAHLRDR